MDDTFVIMPRIEDKNHKTVQDIKNCFLITLLVNDI